MNQVLDRSFDSAGSTESKVAIPEFIPASTWQGSKSGYYFGTSVRGTGYHRDISTQHQQSAALTSRHATHNGGTVTEEPHSNGSRKRIRKSVQIDEDQNETRVILSPEELLERAERQQRNSSKSTALLLDLTPKGMRKAVNALKKAIEVNELQRAQHVNEPERYMESEVALYEHIAAWKAIASDPTRLFPIAIEMELVQNLLQLLLHDNVDLAAAVISTLVEWLDPDLLQSKEESESGEEEAALLASVAAVASIVVHEGAEPLVSNLSRLNSNNEEDEVGKGIEDVMTLIENLIEIDSLCALVEKVALVPNEKSLAAHLCKDTKLLSWCFQQVEENGSLRDRALEIISLMAPKEDVYDAVSDWSRLPPYVSSFAEQKEDGKTQDNSATLDGIEILLQTVAAFRKRQPADETEVERLENAGLIVTSALTFSSTNVEAFLSAQGIELVIRCLKERVHAGGIVLPWLDWTGTDHVYKTACEHMIVAGFLKYLLPLLMGNHTPKSFDMVQTKRTKRSWQTNLETTSIRVLYALTRYLTDKSPEDAKARLLAKFATDSAKCDRVVELLLEYDQKARVAEYKFYRSDVEERLRQDYDDSETATGMVEMAALEAKLTGGGDVFHRIGAVAAWLCVGSKRCHERILATLRQHDSGMSLVQAAVSEFVSVLDEALSVSQRAQLQSYLQKL
jgi:beta-catenin-like protein 1